MALPAGKSVLETIFEDGEALDDDEILVDDVEMLDAEALEGGSDHLARPPDGGGGDGGGVVQGRGESQRGLGVKTSGKRHKRLKKKKRAPSDVRVTDINRFVINTCRHLREKKSYLVWNAVGCLGVSAVSDLVKEVDAIQSCGGQKTADGKRFRSGGGILWNILKAREPKAYKEIMAKGREFERQFKPLKATEVRKVNEAAIFPSTSCEAEGSVGQELDGDLQPAEERPGSEAQELDDLKATEEQPPASTLIDSKEERSSILSRIRKPVAYDDLFE
ncbi:unnamed protein product [Spirodela intermedia]|uniref:Phosphorylated adapter RNA export protein n=1 Tax=Spirodela intermedia TaxID=51605 RepID=A0A7I8J852_SPIIN|nr:unnamed protein product [Spirodela intermedia]CAA6666269.1 unnamed protein product [Spirodela intermedia]